MIEKLSKKRSVCPGLDHYCNVSRAAAIAVLDALATIVQKDPTILGTIEQAMPQGEQREAYRAWLDQYRACQDCQTTLDKGRLGSVFSFLGTLTETLVWTDLRETAHHHSATIVNDSAKCPHDGLSKDSFLDGDPDEVAFRLMSMVFGSPDKPDAVFLPKGTVFYRESVTQALSVVIAALQRGGYAYTLADFVRLLMSPSDLDKLPNLSGIRGTPEGRGAASLINRFRVPNRDGGTMIDTQKVKDFFGGIVARLACASGQEPCSS